VQDFIANSTGYNAENSNCATLATCGAKAAGASANSSDTLKPNLRGKWFLRNSGQSGRNSITVDSPVKLYESLIQNGNVIEEVKKPNPPPRPILEGIRE
jgi:hypothetical protein